MQDDIFGSSDEFEPREMPRQALKFDSVPCPVVPEVSLIMDKPIPSNNLDDNPPDKILELRSFNIHEPSIKATESYAVWKEKQFPQQSIKTPLNHFDKSYSSAQNNSLQIQCDYKQPTKPYKNSLDNNDYNYKKQNIRSESPRQPIQRNSSENDDPNKYSLNHTDTSNTVVIDHANNSYKSRTRKRDERRSSNDKRHFDHSDSENRHEYRHKSRIHRSSSYTFPDLPNQRNMSRDYDYQLRHSTSLPPAHCNVSPIHCNVPPMHCNVSPVHCNADHSHNCSCCLNHSKSNRDTETVKNLLQVITSQNEQIKNLQRQLERLLKLHEQSLKEKCLCTCQSNGYVYQNTQLYDQSQMTNLPVAHKSKSKDNERCYSDLKLQDEKTKQTIVEQKVSIGVMTSFELKVQNNPSLGTDNELKQKNNQEKVVSSLETSNMIKNLVNDTGEMIRKKGNFFTHTPLENISEGSESHMSSLRHSHINPDNTRRSIEPHDYTEVQNVNFFNQNYREIENAQKDSELRRREKLSNNKNNNNNYNNNNSRPTSRLDYEVRKPRYQETNDDFEERPHQYNLQYVNSLSQEDLNDGKYDEFHSEPILNDIVKTKNIKFDNLGDECLSLSSSELDVEDQNPPSPPPTIQILDLQEYSSENGSLPPQRAAKVGWTLYNNVVDQVNQILQNSPRNDNSDSEMPDVRRKNENKEFDNNNIADTVKAATLEQLTKLGISFSDNIDQTEPTYNKKVMFDASCYSRPFPETHLAAASASIETNTSLHMKALAMKYLNEDQLAEMTLQKPRSGHLKSGSNNIQSTNMSFATMRYLQRYHLLPGSNSSPKRDARREEQRVPRPSIRDRIANKVEKRREQIFHGNPPFTGSSKISDQSKILDISTLKQQPKLL